ncbi:glycosyltransferase [Lacinutrix neustonica]|uniref:Glycosyltransferase n=1 Tax=Lacinutrix neustonica TaxID=2980107 RepID=A0A9E8MVZ0_9FLAO|nr:glycosyltransferase [Lacinutrix neustonica]WAC01944.1 glycosyltransferase [Lacinutrix neustonica]
MGTALLYIGNSASDGLPNTLLEAIVCGAFPIQSNPGGASEDIITTEKNGLLIQECSHIETITQQIKKALETPDLIEQAYHYNQNIVKPQLEITLIKAKVLKAYKSVVY